MHSKPKGRGKDLTNQNKSKEIYETQTKKNLKCRPKSRQYNKNKTKPNITEVLK